MYVHMPKYFFNITAFFKPKTSLLILQMLAQNSRNYGSSSRLLKICTAGILYRYIYIHMYTNSTSTTSLPSFFLTEAKTTGTIFYSSYILIYQHAGNALKLTQHPTQPNYRKHADCKLILLEF
jgi:hypothetical protein